MRVAVVGAGVIGLAAVARLRANGADVVCYERSGAVMSERSAGSSRIFRLAHSTPELVSSAQRARVGFRRWEQDAGTPLVDASGCVISGAEMHVRASAMESAGAPYEIVDASSDRVRLPAVQPPGEALIDLTGGVIDVDAVRCHLVALTQGSVVHEPVYALEHEAGGATVWSPTGKARFDAVLLAAGAGTSPLAAQAGIYTPSALAHHVRFTFPIGRSVSWRCWIDKPAAGLATYQHLSGPGRWAIGGHLDPTLTAWEVGREDAVAASREAVLQYARERLAVEPRIVESLYCAQTPDLGDGFEVRRNGSILAVYGEHLFKLAPVVGEALAAACLDGSEPGRTPAPSLAGSPSDSRTP